MVASWPGTKMANGRENYPMLLAPIGPLYSGVACLCGPPSGDWLQMFHPLGHSIWQPWNEISGCELKLWIQSFNVGTKALARNKTNHLVWVNPVLVTLFGTPFIHHQWGSLSDMGMPLTWEKGSHLPPGTTKLGNLRDGCDSATAPNAKPDLGFSSRIGGCCSVEPTQGCQKCDGWGCTGTLDGLVGSHTRLAIYPTLAICCQRLWSMLLSILGSRGCR